MSGSSPGGFKLLFELVEISEFPKLGPNSFKLSLEFVEVTKFVNLLVQLSDVAKSVDLFLDLLEVAKGVDLFPYVCKLMFVSFVGREEVRDAGQALGPAPRFRP